MIRYKRGKRPYLSLFVEDDHISQAKLGWELSPAKLVQWLTTSYQAEIHQIYWYLSSPQELQEEYLKEELRDYELIKKIQANNRLRDLLKPTELYNKSTAIAITIDMFLTHEDYDYTVLLTGSEELERTVELIRSKQVRILVIGTAQDTSQELRNACDTFIEIQNIRKYISKPAITRPQKKHTATAKAGSI